MADLLACADLIISRGGANAIYEITALAKPNLLLPLSKKASRGDKLINAEYCQQRGLSEVLLEKDLNADTLVEKITKLNAKKEEYRSTLLAYTLPDSVAIIFAHLKKIKG